MNEKKYGKFYFNMGKFILWEIYQKYGKNIIKVVKVKLFGEIIV